MNRKLLQYSIAFLGVLLTIMTVYSLIELKSTKKKQQDISFLNIPSATSRPTTNILDPVVSPFRSIVNTVRSSTSLKILLSFTGIVLVLGIAFIFAWKYFYSSSMAYNDPDDPGPGFDVEMQRATAEEEAREQKKVFLKPLLAILLLIVVFSVAIIYYRRHGKRKLRVGEAERTLHNKNETSRIFFGSAGVDPKARHEQSQGESADNEEAPGDVLIRVEIPKVQNAQGIDSTMLDESPWTIYDKKEELGKGSFGVVYKAVRKDDPSVAVAIKEIDLAPYIKVKRHGKERDMKYMAYNEIVHLLPLEKHQNIAHLSSWYREGAALILVMEFVPGRTLKQILETQSMNEATASVVARETLKALSHLHQHNLMHRDIKPANIMIDLDSKDGALKVIDFGFVGPIGSREVCGSKYYLAPEMNDPAVAKTGAVDIFSLGNILDNELKGASHSENCADFVSKARQEKPGERPSADELLKHLFIIEHIDKTLKSAFTSAKESVY